MTVLQRIALSLLVSVLLSIGFLFLFITGVFSFPAAIIVLLLTLFFLTVFLTLFLILNIRQDPIVIAETRFKQLYIIINEFFYEKKFCIDLSRELEKQKEATRNIIKKGIKIQDQEKEKDIDVLFNKFWDQLLIMIDSHRISGIDEEKLKNIFCNALQDVIKKEPEQNGDVIEILDELEAVQEPEEELEELSSVEDVEDVEELEVLEEVEPEIITETDKKSSSKLDIAEIASLIEFGELSASKENEEDQPLEEDLEIASPFASMFGRSKDTDQESGSVETFNSNEGLSVVHKPFLTVTQSEIQTLEALPGEDDIPVLEEIIDDPDGIDDAIEERNGVYYVKKGELDSSSSPALNKDLKKLVDSVIS